MPTARYLHGVASTSQGKIYAIGGVSNAQQSALATNEEYDIATDTWRARAPFPTVIYQAGVACLNDKVYVCGGRDSTNGWATNQLREYDPVTDSWRSLAPLPAPSQPPLLPSFGPGYAPAFNSGGGPYGGRFNLSFVASNGKLWALGGAPTVLIVPAGGGSGSQNNQGWFVDSFVYDPATNAWSPGPSIVCSSTGSVAGGSIVILDGFHVTRPSVSVLLAPQPFSLQWGTGSSFSDSFPNIYPANGAEPKMDNGVVGLGNLFYVLGGRLASTGFSQTDVVSFDTTVLPTLSATTLAPMGQDRFDFAACAVPNAGATGRVYVVGGAQGTGVQTPFGVSFQQTDLASVEEYQP
jgi:hypothetical protein